jgi:bifunctional non-homologous end joining protein LigD
VADTSRTGTVTRPKLIEPVQIAFGTAYLQIGRTPAASFPLPSQVVAPRTKKSSSEPPGNGGATRVEVGGHTLLLSNLAKVLYPETGFTKGEVIDYYARVAPAILPHLRGRPLTMVRLPDGVDGERFFEKRCPGHRPAWVRTVPLDAGSSTPACSVDDLPSLVWVANLAALELHTPQAPADDPLRPTAMVFDLDPGPPAGVLDCARVALDLRDLLGQLGLQAVVKTSGNKGLHLSVGLRPEADAEHTKAFALALGRILESRDPRRVTVTMAREQRSGRVFVDWSQNDRHKTTVCAYSLRATARPQVSAPVTWDEVSDALETADPDRLRFEATDVIARVADRGDLYAASLAGDQELPELS